MKKTFRLIIAATAAITALASCAKDIATEEILNPQEAEGQRVITIAYDAETKTSQDYDWHKVHFVEGDQIKVMDNSGTETCTIHINDGVASFSTSLTGDLTAVYPKECGYKSGRAQTITVSTYPPHFQDGTLASGHIASAQIPAGSTKAVFHNETALLRIITPAGTKQLTVTSLNDYINISDGEIVDGGYSNEAKKSVVVGDGTKELGTCYVSIHPGAKIGGLSFDAGVGSKTISSTVETKAGVAYTISDESWNIPVEDIFFNISSYSTYVGSESTITATVTPYNATNKHITWSSSNTSVAKVTATSETTAKVTALAPGTATITATTVDGAKTVSLTVTVKEHLPDGALSGVFSVSSTKKVHFSKGNLQATYDGSTYTWGFAKNQYDYIGHAPGNTTIDKQKVGAVVDLFGWSTGDTYYGISTSTVNQDYSGAFVDWGTAIDDKGTWRTLSLNEWEYLLSRSGKCKHPVNICGVKGCGVIAPDNFTGTIEDKYDESSWKVAEAAGLICLPPAGWRVYDDVDDITGESNYWTSTRKLDAYINCILLYPYDSEKIDFGTDCYSEARRGSSVRLVTDVK